LEKQFKLDIDYKRSLLLQQKQKNDGRGGYNKEIFMLTVKTFKLFCIKAGTEKANEIHEYFIKLEEILQQT
jgi:phage anti-repressor protein